MARIKCCTQTKHLNNSLLKKCLDYKTPWKVSASSAAQRSEEVIMQSFSLLENISRDAVLYLDNIYSNLI